MKHGFGFREVATVILLASSPTLALAYIDPGNGAYMVQALMTMVAAGIFYLRHPVRTLKAIGRWLSDSLSRRASKTEIATAEASVVSSGSAGVAQPSEEN